MQHRAVLLSKLETLQMQKIELDRSLVLPIRLFLRFLGVFLKKRRDSLSVSIKFKRNVFYFPSALNLTSKVFVLAYKSRSCGCYYLADSFPTTLQLLTHSFCSTLWPPCCSSNPSDTFWPGTFIFAFSYASNLLSQFVHLVHYLPTSSLCSNFSSVRPLLTMSFNIANQQPSVFPLALLVLLPGSTFLLLLF